MSLKTAGLKKVPTHEALRKIDAVTHEGMPLEKWRISSTSIFEDDEWVMDGTVLLNDRRVRFSTPLPLVQASLTDPGYEGLLLDSKLILWGATIAQNPSARGDKPQNNMRYLRAVYAWMIREHLPDFSYVTRDRVWADGDIENPRTFAAFLLEHLGGNPDEIAPTTVINYLNKFSVVFGQFAILEAFDRPTLPEHPFGTNENTYLASRIAQKEMEEWRPVPDEVLVPLLNASEDWLGQKADDVAHALEIFQEGKRAHLNRGVGRRQSVNLAKVELAKFQFALEGGDPWHPPLDNFSYGGNESSPDESLKELGRLVRMVQSAAMIAIQQSSGMRSGELLDVRSKRRNDGSPSCIEERKVANGAKSLVIIHSVTTKINGGIPEAHEWIVGVKPNLPFVSPPEVRAQRAVNVLMRIGDLLKGPNSPPDVANYLMVAWGSASVPTDGSTLRPFTNDSHNMAIRYFLKQTCGEHLALLPDDSAKLVQDGWLGQWRETGGQILHSHQLRKAFANFAYSMEPGLKEEIRIQYGHVSLAMTSRYTNNVHQIKQMNEMEAAMAAEHIVAALSESALAGKGAEELERRGDWIELRQRFEVADPADRHQVVTEWMLETRRLVDEEYRISVNGKRELRKARRSAISDASHGLCAAISIQGDDMECRKQGGSTDSILNGLGADKRYRTPSRCLGCVNYLVLPKHRPFWEDRFRRSQQAVSFLKGQGHPLSMYEAQMNTAKQSGAWLKAIGVQEGDLDDIAAECAAEAEKRIANG